MSKKALAIAVVVLVAILTILFITEPYLFWSLSRSARHFLSVVGVVTIAAVLVILIIRN